MAMFSLPAIPLMAGTAAATQQVSPSADAGAVDDTDYIQQLLNNPKNGVVDLPYRPSSAPFIIRPGLTIPRGEVINGHGTTLKVKDNYGDYRAIMTAPPTTDLSGLKITGIVFDQNASGNPITTSPTPASPRFVLAFLAGTGITITQNMFINTNNTNTVVTGSATRDVVLSYSTFSTVNVPWHDHSSVYTSGTNTVIYGNKFNGNASLAAAIEVHGDKVNIQNNTINDYYRGTNIVASNTTFSNNTVYRAANVVDLWSTVAPGLHDVTITQNRIQIDLAHWEQVLKSLGRTMPARQYTQFVIYDAVSTYPFTRISIQNNTSIPLQ
ncbi:right-handed parallel beta-helix repeat-containing protein [Kitasatospora sp. NPDC051914]|uniref:right-handed parallel beta-helix repeat-containing protein n=1 Tax=Kitasatospora sp. NPDC051914 TaxID=3154945 RepID=UPI003443D520